MRAEVTANRKKRVIKELTSKTILTCIMGVIGLMTIMPVIFMISSSLKREVDIFQYPIEWIPSIMVNNYAKVWLGDYEFHTFYFNSVKVTVSCIIGLVITSSMAAYGFSKQHFKGRDLLFLIYMATLMIPTQVTMVPRFVLYKYLNIYNTHLALILPGIFTAFGTFLLRQYMISVPIDLNESAKIDGAGDFRILFQIIMPVIKPALITLVLIASVWSWNDYENALLFITTKKLYTVPIGLISFMDETGKLYSLIMAAAVSAVIPPMMLFLAGQRYFIEGLTTGAVKG
jgi:multiple sugar transport system permease protein